MIERERHGAVEVLRLAHGKVNALDLELVTALAEALDACRGAGAVVLTGRGRTFSAGVDLKRLLAEDGAYLAHYLRELDKLFRRLLLFPRPVVAAVNGHALAGGWILACGADLRLAAAGEATVGVTELAVGLPFPRSALETFRLATPAHLAGRLAIQAARVGVAEALRLGLLDELVDAGGLEARAVELAAPLAAVPADALEHTKRQLRDLHLGPEGGPELDEVIRRWNDPATRRRVAAYMEAVARRGATAP